MILQELDVHDVKEILNKNWMTHDAMWFFHTVSRYGIEETNKLNLSAIEGMAAIEAKRLVKLAGLEKDKTFDSFDEFYQFFDWVFSLVKPDFMNFEYHSPEKNLIIFTWHSCFAHEGMKKLGTIKEYHCGIVHRIRVWFDALGIKYSLEPDIKHCIMHEKGACEGTWHFYFTE